MTPESIQIKGLYLYFPISDNSEDCVKRFRERFGYDPEYIHHLPGRVAYWALGPIRKETEPQPVQQLQEPEDLQQLTLFEAGS